MNLPSPKILDSDVVITDDESDEDPYTNKSKLLDYEVSEKREYFNVNYDQRGVPEGWGDESSDFDSVDASSNESDYKGSKIFSDMPITNRQYYDIPYSYQRGEFFSSFGTPALYYYKNSCCFCLRHYKCCCFEFIPYGIVSLIIYVILFLGYFCFVYIPEFSDTAVCYIFFNSFCEQFSVYKELFLVIYRDFEIPLFLMLIWMILQHVIYPLCSVIPYHRVVEKTYRINTLGRRRRSKAVKRRKYMKWKMLCSLDYVCKNGCSCCMYVTTSFLFGVVMTMLNVGFYYLLFPNLENESKYINSPSLLFLGYALVVFFPDILLMTCLTPFQACFMSFQLDQLCGYGIFFRHCFNPKTCCMYSVKSWKRYIVELPIIILLCWITQFIPFYQLCHFPIMLITLTRWYHQSKFIDHMGVFKYHKRLKKRNIRNYRYRLERYMEMMRERRENREDGDDEGGGDDYFVKKSTPVIAAADYKRKGFFSSRKEGRSERMRKILERRRINEDGGTDSEGDSEEGEGEDSELEEMDENFGEVDELIVQEEFVIEDEIGEGFLS